MSSPDTQVNLYRGRRTQVIDKALAWSVTIGRGLVVVTELVALVAFAYRFTLDRQILDLKDQVKQKLTLVQAMANNEKTYRNVQTRTQLIKNAQTANTTWQTRMQAILKALPTPSALNSVTFDSGSTRIDAQFTTSAAATAFVNTLRALPDTVSVSVDKIDDKPSLGIINLVVTITQKNIAPIL